MFGTKRFDLRVRNLFAPLRDSYVGATASRADSDAREQKGLLLLLILSVALVTVISFGVSSLL